MTPSGSGSILHVDLDAFYASVEQLRRPELAGLPVAVGGGVVLAASYEARAYGVRAAMPIGRARRLCPALIVVDGSYGDYAALSDQVFGICERYTPRLEQISIDEAFLDVSGAWRLFGSGVQIARRIRADVLAETGLVVSVGVARTKFLAKIASRVAKPDGLVAVDPAGELAFLHALPVRLIWGVGPVTERRLADLGIVTVAQLAACDERALRSRVGDAAGRHLHALSWNRDPRRVVTHRAARSVGAQSAFGSGRDDPRLRRRVLTRLADRVAARLRTKGRAGRTVGVRVRFGDLQTVTRAATMPFSVSTTAAIFDVAEPLLEDAVRTAGMGRPVGLIGVRVSGLSVEPQVQLELPFPSGGPGERARTGSPASQAEERLDRAVDALRARFGKAAVARASVMLDGGGFVPDEFGDLAIPAHERRLGRREAI